jgi:hypothetical protein
MITLIVVVLIVFLLFGGYGRYGRAEPWGWGPSFGPLGFLLLILLIVYLSGGFRHL